MRSIVPLAFAVVLLAGAFAGCVDPGLDGAGGKSAKQIQATKKSPAVYPGEYKFDGQYSHVLVEGTLKALPPVHQFIKSKVDGVDIEIGYWLPDVPDGTKVPVIVHASPYHRPAGTIVKATGMKLFLVDNFVPLGYAVAAVAVRGTADSGGCMDLMGKKEVADLDQAITWLGTQPWSNGNVGMTGVSYDGSTPWSVAATGNPYLKTIVPISGVPDLYGLMFKNGSAELRGPLLLNYLYYEYGWAPVSPLGGGDPDRTAQHRIEGVVCPESFTGFAAALYSGTYGERDPLGWWNERNRKPGVEKNFKGSILSVQGLQDWNVDPHMVLPWVDQLNQSGVPVKQLMGQWPHASPHAKKSDGTPQPYTRYDWAEILLHWFDKYLKELPNIDTGPAVQVQDQTFHWRNEESWPPHDATWSMQYLATGSKLAPEPGPAGSILLLPTPLVGEAAANNLRSVPNYNADFSTGPVEKDLLISGLPRLHVTVTPKGPTGHLAAWLYDVDPSGKETRVGWTMMNLLFADGSEKAKPLVPNMPIVAKMQFQPLDVDIQAGHRLMARVWQYQEADRLPGLPPEPVELLFGGTSRSVLELPVIERTPEDYFQAPMPAK